MPPQKLNVVETPLYPVEPDVLRFELVRQQPYLRTVVYRLRPRENPNINTFATDAKWHWYYGSQVPFTPKQQVTVLYHEVNHLLRNHFERCGDKSAVQWNFAGDLEINDEFPPMMEVPDNIVVPAHFGLPDGEFAEWYYPRIDKWELHVRPDATGMWPGRQPCEVPGCKNVDTLPKIGADHEVSKKGVMHVPACGSGAGGDGTGGADAEGEDDGVGDVEQEAVRRSVAEQIEGQTGRGSVPSSLRRWAGELLHPEVPWERLLRTYARRASIIISGMTDQTYSRPSRREYEDFLLPKRISHKTSAAFYVDTSGSIDQEMLDTALTEVRAALRSNAAELWVSFIDTDVKSTVKLSTQGQARLLVPKGGGGTNMRVCFEHYKKLKPKVNLIVVLTDGETPWPDEPPHGVHTIVVWTKRKGRAEHGGTVPVWAKTVKVGDRK